MEAKVTVIISFPRHLPAVAAPLLPSPRPKAVAVELRPLHQQRRNPSRMLRLLLRLSLKTLDSRWNSAGCSHLVGPIDIERFAERI